MLRIVRQSVLLPAAPEALYAMYLSPRRHATITSGPVQIGARAGSRFSAFGGALSDRMLQTIPGRLVVQAWRSSAFHDDDPDSTLNLRFLPAGRKRGRIDLVHVNVPPHDYHGASTGWRKYYWRPWRAYPGKVEAGRG